MLPILGWRSICHASSHWDVLVVFDSSCDILVSRNGYFLRLFEYGVLFLKHVYHCMSLAAFVALD